MINMEDRVRDKLEGEAARWVDDELVVRMAYARDAIEYQADLSSVMCGAEGAKRHIKEATAFAEENIRNDLEFEAQAWVEGEMNKR